MAAKKTINVRLPEDVVRDIRRLATWHNRSLAGELREALQDYSRQQYLELTLAYEEDRYIRASLARTRRAIERKRKREAKQRELVREDLRESLDMDASKDEGRG